MRRHIRMGTAFSFGTFYQICVPRTSRSLQHLTCGAPMATGAGRDKRDLSRAGNLLCHGVERAPSFHQGSNSIPQIQSYGRICRKFRVTQPQTFFDHNSAILRNKESLFMSMCASFCCMQRNFIPSASLVESKTYFLRRHAPPYFSWQIMPRFFISARMRYVMPMPSESGSAS